MANRVLSIDIGYSITKIVEVDFRQKNSKVYNCFAMQTPAGLVDDGYIKESEAFSTALREELAKRDIKTKKVVFTITSTKIANREVPIPAVKQNRIDSMVQAKAGDYFPVDVRLYKFSYSILDTLTEGDTKQYKLLVLATPKDLLESYYSLAENAGLTIEALDYSGNSIIPVIKSTITDDVTMIIKVDERATLLTVLSDTNIVLQRSVAYGADAAIQAIEEHEVFGTDMTYQGALDLLRGHAIIRKSFDATVKDDDDEANYDERYRQARIDVTESLSTMVGAITRVIDYYNSRNSDRQISRILLTGFGGDFSGLSKLLTNEIGTKVAVLNKVSAVNLDRSIKSDNISIGEYLACIGAAISPLDMIPDEKKSKKKIDAAQNGGKKDYTKLEYMVAVGTAAVAVILALMVLIPYMVLKQDNKKLNEQLTQLMPIVDTYNKYMDTKALYDEVQKMYSMTATRNDGLKNFMEEMEQKIPSKTVISSFTSDGTTVTMGITADSKEAAANFINEMRSFDSIASLSVSSITETVEEETGVRSDTFTITCTYKPAEAVSSNSVSGEAAQ